MTGATRSTEEQTYCVSDYCNDDGTTPHAAEELREAVSKRYAGVVIGQRTSCGCGDGVADVTSARRSTSAVVAFRPLPENGLNDSEAYTGCKAGAFVITGLQKVLKDTGFVDIRITPKDESNGVIDDWAPRTDVSELCCLDKWRGSKTVTYSPRINSEEPALGYGSTVYLLPVLIGVNLYNQPLWNIGLDEDLCVREELCSVPASERTSHRLDFSLRTRP